MGTFIIVVSLSETNTCIWRAVYVLLFMMNKANKDLNGQTTENKTSKNQQQPQQITDFRILHLAHRANI